MENRGRKDALEGKMRWEVWRAWSWTVLESGRKL
jgi:hypothetical protein